jgi:hypothetical protein
MEDKPMNKILIILFCEWLPKTGDADKLLIRISIGDEVEGSTHDNGNQQTVIVIVSRSWQNAWQRRCSCSLERSELEKVLLDFAVSAIRERITAGGMLESGEELILNEYTSYIPPDPNTLQINPGYREIYEVKRKLGFLR